MSEEEGFGDPNELFKSGPFSADLINSRDKESDDAPAPDLPTTRELTQEEKDEFERRGKALFGEPAQEQKYNQDTPTPQLRDISPQRQSGAPAMGEENLPKFDIVSRPNEGAIEQDKLKKNQKAWYQRILNRNK